MYSSIIIGEYNVYAFNSNILEPIFKYNKIQSIDNTLYYSIKINSYINKICQKQNFTIYDIIFIFFINYNKIVLNKNIFQNIVIANNTSFCKISIIKPCKYNININNKYTYDFNLFENTNYINPEDIEHIYTILESAEFVCKIGKSPGIKYFDINRFLNGTYTNDLSYIYEIAGKIDFKKDEMNDEKTNDDKMNDEKMNDNINYLINMINLM